MAPILEEMERRIQEEVDGMVVCSPSYVDDPHCWLYDRRSAGAEIDEREKMQSLVVQVHKTVTNVHREHVLLFGCR